MTAPVSDVEYTESANHHRAVGSDGVPTDSVGTNHKIRVRPFKFEVSDGSLLDLPSFRQVGMNIDALRPQNTQNARSVGVNAFTRFLELEDVGLDYVFECMAKDPNGRCLVAVMDKFAMHLAFAEGVKLKPLAKNTVMSYFRHVKNWLLGIFPDCHAAIDVRLREMGRILEKHMNKRESGGMTKHARACTKKDLALLVRYLYMNATTSTDCEDAARVCLLWYVFGRASDFSLVQKQGVSVCSSKNFFIRLVRVKTSEQ